MDDVFYTSLIEADRTWLFRLIHRHQIESTAKHKKVTVNGCRVDEICGSKTLYTVYPYCVKKKTLKILVSVKLVQNTPS